MAGPMGFEPMTFSLEGAKINGLNLDQYKVFHITNIPIDVIVISVSFPNIKGTLTPTVTAALVDAVPTIW